MAWKKNLSPVVARLLLAAAVITLTHGASAAVSRQDETEVVAEPELLDVEETEFQAEPVINISPSDPIEIKEHKLWSEEDRAKSTKGISYTQEKKEEEIPDDGVHEAKEFEEPGKSWLASFFETRGAQVIILTIIIAFLIYFLLRFLSDRSLVREGKVDKKQYSLEHLEENLTDSDMEHFLRLALDAGDYRTAIRVFYLTIIRDLHEKEFIQWKKEKTNFDYVRELRGSSYFDSFRKVTRAFELVWYGNAHIEEREYRLLEPQFRQFIQHMNNGTGK